jgi:hypothetical protein
MSLCNRSTVLPAFFSDDVSVVLQRRERDRHLDACRMEMNGTFFCFHQLEATEKENTVLDGGAFREIL